MKTYDPPVRLSRRIANLKPSATLAVTARVKELAAEGRDVLGFGSGEPDFDTPQRIKQAAIDALLGGATHYVPVAGEPAARAAVAEKFGRDNGIDCAVDDVVITVGGKHAIYMVVQCLIEEGVEAIIPTPAWVSYRPMVELAGGRVIEVPGTVDNDFKITPSQLDAAITERTGMLILNSPSNPCGTMYSADELRALAEVVAPHDGITIVSDEIYEKLIYGGIDHFSVGSIGSLADRVVTVNGLSKAFAMTGWRIGFACAPGGLAKSIIKLQGQMTSNITSFCHAAIVEALTGRGDEVEQMRRTFAERGERMHRLVTAIPGVRCPRPTGAFYVFPDVGALYGKRSPGGVVIDSSVIFAEALLEEAGVGVVPGADFGECGHRHVRLSFACSTEQIDEGCRRLHEWVQSLR